MYSIEGIKRIMLILMDINYTRQNKLLSNLKRERKIIKTKILSILDEIFTIYSSFAWNYMELYL